MTTILKKGRSFISAATAFTFVPTMLTSILLLFHVRFPGVMDIHKWVGLAFILLCFCHIPINWSVLRKHLDGRAAMPALVLTSVLTIAMLTVGLINGDSRGHGGYGNHARYSQN